MVHVQTKHGTRRLTNCSGDLLDTHVPNMMMMMVVQSAIMLAFLFCLWCSTRKNHDDNDVY